MKKKLSELQLSDIIMIEPDEPYMLINRILGTMIFKQIANDGIDPERIVIDTTGLDFQDKEYDLGEPWTCPQCKAVNGYSHLFCQNYEHIERPLDERVVNECRGVHPQYDMLTRRWPVRTRTVRKSYYYS